MATRKRVSAGAADTICHVLRRYLRQGTNLGIAIPILIAQINSLKAKQQFHGLTEKEIQLGFRGLSSRYFKSEYHPTDLNRAQNRFLSTMEGRYRFREELMVGVSVADLNELRSELVESLRIAYEERRAIIRRMEETKALPAERMAEQYALVESYLKQLSGNHGEMFEVVSFAVLREYFRSFGFSLHRFSTTQANDGGIDFVGGEAIYQVTVDESLQKLQRDLAKAPGTKRVLVRCGPVPATFAGHENVLEVIELKDLLSHFISWLMARDKRSRQAAHVQRVLEVALTEFRREIWAESAEVAQSN
jgi:uncharacterized protein YnzC (UPF0291/DUF896 family)